MHMANTLISPVVGTTMLITSGGLIAYSAKKMQHENLKDKLTLMGVAGAFVFASQMINFTIPGTGSSGHLGGGMLLAILLGPYAGFLTMAAILLIQAVFFADGGLLAYGCNVFNLGFYTCFIAYPFIYKPLIAQSFSKKRLFLTTLFSSIIGLQLGAFSVVLQTLLSGKTSMSFIDFILAMQPIHLAIGVVEGVILGFSLCLIAQTQPLLLENTYILSNPFSFKKFIITTTLITFVVGGIFSLFASSHPDGLEWALLKITGSENLQADSPLHIQIDTFQKKLAILPDYGFKISETNPSPHPYHELIGTSSSGIVGSLLTAFLAILLGSLSYLVKKMRIIHR